MQYKKKWYTISEAAKYLGVSPDTLRRWEKAKKIPAPTRTAGRARRYSKELLDEILGSGKEKKPRPSKPVSPKSSSTKQLLIGLITTIITLAILLPILLFLF